MIKDILQDEFMDYREVYAIAESRGVKKSKIKAEKRAEGIQTISVKWGDETIYLWFDPEKIVKKYART